MTKKTKTPKVKTKTTTKENKIKAVCPSPIRAVIAKSQMYDDMLTIKIWDDRKGRLSTPRQAITDAGYKEGDDIFIVSRDILSEMTSGMQISDPRMAKIKDLLFPCQS